MLWVNLIMDTFAALALATEPPYDTILERQPYNKNEAIVTEIMWRNVFGHAIYQAIAIFTIIFAGQYIGLAEPYEVACSKEVLEQRDEEGAITQIGYCQKYNPYYTHGFYFDDKENKFWRHRVTLNTDEDAEENTTRNATRPEDYDDVQLPNFQCNLYKYKYSEQWNKKVKEAGEGEPWTCNKDEVAALMEEVNGDKTEEDDDYEFMLPVNQEHGAGTQKLILFSYIFQAFVMMQVFNQFNARKLEGELNVFGGMFRNPLFVNITIFTVLMQLAMVEFGGPALKCWPLNVNQNLFCIAVGALELVVGLGIKFLPLGWFQCYAFDEKPQEDNHKSAVSVLKKTSVVQKS